jgi:hypothetical protein
MEVPEGGGDGVGADDAARLGLPTVAEVLDVNAAFDAQPGGNVALARLDDAFEAVVFHAADLNFAGAIEFPGFFKDGPSGDLHEPFI